MILLMTLLVPVVVWIAVRLESSLDRWDRAAAVPEQPSTGESDEALGAAELPPTLTRRQSVESPTRGDKPAKAASVGRHLARHFL